MLLQVIVLERNRRVAKAYARAPVVTVNGSEEGFDGFRIGSSPFLSIQIFRVSNSSSSSLQKSSELVIHPPFLSLQIHCCEKTLAEPIKAHWAGVRCQNLAYEGSLSVH